MMLSNRKLRLIIITLLLLIFCFFIGIFKPKAQVITQPWNFNVNVPGRYGYQDYIFSGAPFYGVPQGKIIFTANFNSINNEYDITSISSIYLTSTNGNKFACTLGNYDVNAGTYSTTTGNPNNYFQSISVECPIDFSNSDNLKSVMFVLNYATEIDGTYNIKVSEYATYVSDSNSQIANNTNDIKNSINDSSIDSSGASSSASSWNSKNATNGTITNLLTLPITLLNAIVNGLQTSCSSFSLGSLFNTNIVLPCINVGNLIGDGLWTTIDILFSGFMILAIGKKLIKIFNDFTNLKSNQMDELYGGGNK